MRDDRSYTIHNAGPLRPNDHVYLFAPPNQVGLLDRVYGPPSPTGDEELLGDFSLPGSASLAEVARQYGIDLRPGVETDLIGKYLEQQLPNPPEVGDRISLGLVDLVVRSLDEDGAIREVGLSLEPAASPRRDLRYLLRRVRDLLRGRSSPQA